MSDIAPPRWDGPGKRPVNDGKPARGESQRRHNVCSKLRDLHVGGLMTKERTEEHRGIDIEPDDEGGDRITFGTSDQEDVTTTRRIPAGGKEAGEERKKLYK